MSTIEQKITPILNDINGAVENKLFYAALSLALTLPDICSSLCNGSKTNGKKYSEWLTEYFIPIHDYEVISANDIYALRCSFLHNGQDEISSQRMQDTLHRFTFLNTYRGIRFHNVKKTIHITNSESNKVEEYVSTIINTDTFANQMTQSVKLFLDKNKNDDKINLEAVKMMYFEDDRNGFSF